MGPICESHPFAWQQEREENTTVPAPDARDSGKCSVYLVIFFVIVVKLLRFQDWQAELFELFAFVFFFLKNYGP